MVRISFFIYGLLGMAWLSFPDAHAQFGRGQDPLNLEKVESFLERVDPIITREEREIYQGLPDSDARLYFEGIFWHKRDADPGTVENDFKKEMFTRREEAKLRFGEGDTPGHKTDRGKIYILLGEPDNVVQNLLPQSGARRSYEEIWEYEGFTRKIKFATDPVKRNMALQDAVQLEPLLERARDALVLDRAEPYRLSPLPLTLPNLGFTEDIENLAAEDVNQLRYRVDYAFFKGDLNRVEVMAVLTVEDASDRGMIVHLVAYDPYENKVCDFKKRIDPVNGRAETFSVTLDPDQYDVVLRLDDRDGRRSIDRRTLDVPHIGGDRSSSSLLAVASLARVPLQGFLHPKKFVFEDLYFPMQNLFRGFRGERLYLMQHFYGYDSLPEVRFYIDQQPVGARTERKVVEEKAIRAVFSIPAESLRSGTRHITSVFPDGIGNLAVQPLALTIGETPEPSAHLLDRAQPSTRLSFLLPAGNDVGSLNRVALRTDPDLIVRRMFVFLNGKLILERDQAPWGVSVDEGLFSVSGENTLAVVVDSGEGYLKVEKQLTPLRADERIKTRLAQIYFNAYNDKLEFVSDLDLNSLQVEVDGVAYTPKKVVKVDEPITYCFLVDTSYSMRESFKENISALRKFIESMRPQDEGYFITFNDNFAQYLLPTPSKAVLLAVASSLSLQRPNPKFGDKLYEENTTFLYDAVISTIQTLLQYSGRKVILLVSDGIGSEGTYSRHGMLSYARENEVVIYSLWLDNNPKVSEDEFDFLQKEMTKAEKFVRVIGLSRFFAKKDERKNYIGAKIRNESITQGVVQILAEESGGFHYRIFRADRSLIHDYVRDIESALDNQFMMTLSLPVSVQKQHVEIFSEDPFISIRCKSEVKVRKTNPLSE